MIYASVRSVAIAQMLTISNQLPALLELSLIPMRKVQFKLLEDSLVLQLTTAISALSTTIARKELITDFNIHVKTGTCVR